MWVIPSHGRPYLLKKLADSFGPEDLKQPVVVMLSHADKRLAEYQDISWPGMWRIHVLPADKSYCGDKMNAAVEMFSDAKFYGLLVDDMWIETPDKLQELAEAAGDWNIAYPWDGVHVTGFLVAHPVCGGKLVRAIGWWAHPMLKHNCIDSVITDIGNELKCVKWMHHVKYGMVHPDLRKTIWDETYERVNIEEINYTAGYKYQTLWCEHTMRQETFNRIRAAMEADNG